MDENDRPILEEMEPNLIEQPRANEARSLLGTDRGEIEALICEARRGSSVALGRLLDGCRAYLVNLAHRNIGALLRVKVSASDLVQETSLEALRDFDRFRGVRLEELLAWLRSILLHNAASAQRRYQVSEKRNLGRETHLAAAGDVKDTAPSPRSLLAAVEEQEEVEQAIERLPTDQRKAILMRNRDHLSFAEIGIALERSNAAAHKLWVRAVERLERELSKTDGHR